MGQTTDRRQFLKLVLAGGVGVGVLGMAACAPAASSPTAAPQSNPAASPGATQAPAKSGASKVTLEMWTHFAGKNLEVMNGLLEEFKGKNSDIDFKVTSYGAGEILTKFLAAVAAGAPPDIYHSPGSVPPDLASNKAVAVLDDIVKIPVELLKNFDGVTIYGGKRYGVPVNGGLGAMAYNKDLMDAAGITKIPATWDDLIEFGQSVTKQDMWGVLLPSKPDTMTTQTIWSLLQSNGVEIVSADGKEPAFNTPEGVEVYQFATDLVQKYKVSPVKSYGLTDTWNDYSTGNVGVVNLYPVWLANIQTFKFKTVTAQMPKNKKPGSQFAGNYWTLPTLKAKDATAEAFGRFTSWWVLPENNARWCRDTGGTPTSQAVIDSDIYQKYLKDDPAAQAYLDGLPYARPFPGVPGITGVLTILAEAWEASVLGKSSPKDALVSAETRAADELKRAQK